jgi:Histidine kinase-, DNA gyrase B-, and HSP90-like ATPase
VANFGYQRRAFGSFIPVSFSVPDAAREFRFIRSSEAVPIATLRVPGEVVLEEANVSRTTVRSRPRKSAKRARSTSTAAASMPSTPPGKLRVVVVVVVTASVAVLPVIVPVVVPASGAPGVPRVVDSAYSMIAPQVRAGGLRLEVDAGDPDLRFHADRERVEQILLNLLSNAVKFTAAGGTVRITVAAEADKICLCVVDSGVGIPADKLEAVFEAFFQVEASRSRTYSGTGLGLAISRQLARAMGGDLTVKSALGEGSTFTLSLPRSPS